MQITEKTQKKPVFSKTIIVIISLLLSFYILRALTFDYLIPQLQIYSANRQLDWTLKPKYTDIYEFRNGIAYMEKEGRGSFFSIDGQILEDSGDQQEVYLKNILCLTSNNAESQYKRLYGVSTLYGEIILEPKYTEICGISSEIIIARETSKSPYEFFNHKGQQVIRLGNEYDKVFEFSEGFALLKKDGMYGYMNMEGEVIIPPQFVNAREFSEGYAAVAIENGEAVEGEQGEQLWGFIGRDGSLVIECKYLDVGDFGEGLATFAEGTFAIDIPGQTSPRVVKLYGYMDIDENVIIEPQYFSPSQFSDGVALAVPLYTTAPSSMYTVNPAFRVHIINHNNEKLLEIKNPVFFVFENARDGYIKVQNRVTGKIGLIRNPSY